MIDFHSHILWDVDDGAKDFDTCVKMIKVSIDEGVEYICATPHFIPEEYEINKEEYFYKLNELKKHPELKGINIVSGLEIYINPNIPELYKEDKLWGLNNNKYMLIELPMNGFPRYTKDMIYELKVLGITPIIAHVERSGELFSNRHLLQELLSEGALFQTNCGSLRGDFGSKVKEFSTYLVKNNYIHALGSDGHNLASRPTDLKYGYKIVEELNPALYENLIHNEVKIINGEDIDILSINTKNSKKFSFFNIFKKK